MVTDKENREKITMTLFKNAVVDVLYFINLPNKEK